jgi:hypothetical protein
MTVVGTNVMEGTDCRVTLAMISRAALRSTRNDGVMRANHSNTKNASYLMKYFSSFFDFSFVKLILKKLTFVKRCCKFQSTYRINPIE